MKNKGTTINPKNTKDDNCFQDAKIAALNYQNIDSHPERKLEFLNLNHLLIITIGKVSIFLQDIKTILQLKETIEVLL